MAFKEPEDADYIFKRMTEDLDLNIELIPEVVVSSLDDLELITKFNAAKRELYERGEVLKATTDTGRDLQSIYHACLLEGKKRGLM